MGIFSDVGTFFGNMGTGIADTFSSADQDQIAALCQQVVTLNSRAQQFNGTLGTFCSELDKINALLAQVQADIKAAISKLEVPTQPLSIQAQRIGMSFGFGMSVSGMLFLSSFGAGRVVAANMQTLGTLIERPMQMEMTAADILALNSEVATVSTTIVRATAVANVLKILGNVAAAATVIITLVQEASFGEQMKNQIQTLQSDIAAAKSQIADAANLLKQQKPAILQLAAVVSGGIGAGGSSPGPGGALVIADPATGGNPQISSDVGLLMDNMIQLLTGIDAEEADYTALQNTVAQELSAFNTVFPNCLVQVKSDLQVLQQNVLSAVRFLGNGMSASQVAQGLALSPAMMSAIQAAIQGGVLTASSTAASFTLQLLADESVVIAPASASSNPAAVVSA